MFKYLVQEVTAVSGPALRQFCNGSNADLEWLERHGIEYGSNAYLKKTAFPPDGHWLYYSGNEQLPAFREKAKPAPRGHRPVTPGFGGHVHYGKLRAAAIAAGVRLLTHAPARRLIVDEAGSVLGVELNALPESLWKEHNALYAVVNPWKPLNNQKAERAIASCRALEARVDARRRVRARRGIVLATGGFIYNLTMLAKHRDVLARNYDGLLRLGSMGCDGSGIALGESVGGSTGLMEKMFLGRPLAPPEAFIYGLMVNVRGERFINEDAYQSLFGDQLAEQPHDGRALLILDHEHFWKGVKQSLFPGKGMFMMWGAPALLNIGMGGTKRGRTIASLARHCGIDAAGLERSVADFNARIARGEADSFGKAPDKLVPLAKGPFYAVNVSLSNKYGPTYAFTLGGLVPDEQTGEVRSAAGHNIAGLYVAGRTAVGLCSSGYMSGLSIADTVFSGRRAGRHAAAVRPTP
jgi:3-oxo-5alpha-steroid 4-dehydrogenase